MAELGKLTAVFDADTRKFDAGVRGVSAKVTALTTGFSGLTGGVGSATSALSGLTSPLALAAGGAVVAASAIGGLAVGLFNLVKSSAAAGGELFDLSQKTGFVVETLSGLSIVAKTTGSDIQAISGSLIIFQKNMDAAGDSSSKQGQLFRSLNIDINDNEKALRQVFTALGKMKEGAQQTAIATQFFGRSGAAVLAMIKETNGNLDLAIAKYDKMGLIIKTSAAAASENFNQVLEETELQLSAVTRSIGNELLPVATESLQEISHWLAENKGAWSSWGTSISDTIRGVKSVAESEIGTIIGWVARLSAELSGLPALVKGAAALGAASRGDNAGPNALAEALSVNESIAAKVKRMLGTNPPRRTGTGGGGGGGAAKKADEKFDEFQNLGEFYRRANIEATKLKETQRQLLTDIIATPIRSIEALQRLYETIAGGFDAASPGAGSQSIKALEDFLKLEAPSDAPLRGAVDARDKIRDQMQGLADDLTSVFSRAIGDGFEQGAKRGLVSLAQGLLSIVQDIFLKRLADGLGQILGGSATSSGGSILGKFLGIGGGIIAGGIGGSLGVPGGFGFAYASGGYLPPGKWGVAGERGPEPIYGGTTGMTVVPNGGGGGAQTIIINVPVKSAGSYSSPKSRRELAQTIAQALQGAVT